MASHMVLEYDTAPEGEDDRKPPAPEGETDSKGTAPDNEKLTERVRLPTVGMLTVLRYTYLPHWRLRYERLWSTGDT